MSCASATQDTGRHQQLPAQLLACAPRLPPWRQLRVGDHGQVPGVVASWLVATVRVPVLASLESDDCAQWSPQALKPVAVWCKLGLRSGLQGVHAECSHLTQAIPHAAVLRS
jgi:hypothetical protein